MTIAPAAHEPKSTDRNALHPTSSPSATDGRAFLLTLEAQRSLFDLQPTPDTAQDIAAQADGGEENAVEAAEKKATESDADENIASYRTAAGRVTTDARASLDGAVARELSGEIDVAQQAADALTQPAEKRPTTQPSESKPATESHTRHDRPAEASPRGPVTKTDEPNARPTNEPVTGRVAPKPQGDGEANTGPTTRSNDTESRETAHASRETAQEKPGDASRAALDRLGRIGANSGLPAASAASGGATAATNTAAPSSNSGAVTAIGAVGGASASNANARGLNFTRSPANKGATYSQPKQQPEAVTQVQKQLATVLSTKGGTVTVRLNPQSLGEVRAQVHVSDGTVTARLEASTGSARALLSEHADSLKAALEARGLRVERLEIAETAQRVSVARATTTPAQDAPHHSRPAGDGLPGSATPRSGGEQAGQDASPSGEHGRNPTDPGPGDRRGADDRAPDADRRRMEAPAEEFAHHSVTDGWSPDGSTWTVRVDTTA